MTNTLENKKLEKTIKEVFDDNYIIPLYQRNFAWKKNEIQLLLQDLYESYKSYKVDNSIHYYIGTLVCLYDAQKNLYEVIDGQQRLTVLTLLSKILQFEDSSKINYESRPEVEDFFKQLFEISGSSFKEYSCKIQELSKNTVLDNFADALDAFYESNIDAKSEKVFTLIDFEEEERKQFTEFITQNVILLRTNIPSDTDVASYFEIMNNRGEQLKKTDVIKAQIMDKIKVLETGAYDKENQARFTLIWNACTEMDIPIQKSFSYEDKQKLFGSDYQSIITENIKSINVKMDNNSLELGKNLASILNDIPTNTDVSTKKDEEDSDDSAYSSIIDFPNFLMHVIKLYCNQKKIILSFDFSLDEKLLLDEFKELKNKSSFNSMEFAEYLLFYRTCLDRFIVMQKNDNPSDENDFNWALIRPVRKQNTNDNKKYNFYYKRSFVFEDENGQDEIKKKEELLTEKIIKVLSLFQVTYRNKKNKRWLNDLLSSKFFKFSENKNFQDISGEDYLAYLREEALKNYSNIKENIDLDTGGTGIHHYIFNYIDYLYWVSASERKLDSLNAFEESTREKKLINEINLIQNNVKYNFDFRYYTSVEHHYAQNYLLENLQKNSDEDDKIEAEKIKPLINSIGNLCLISKKANSRLSDVSPREKVLKRSDKSNICPNRYIIYKETLKIDRDVWNSTAIQDHKECIELLLSKSKEILGINNITQ